MLLLLPRRPPLLFLHFFILLPLVTAGAAQRGVTLSIALDDARSNFSLGACDGLGGGAHMFMDHPNLHLPTVFFWMKFHDELGAVEEKLCGDESCSSREGSSFYLPLDAMGGHSSISLSRKMTLFVEQEIKDSSGFASVVPLYSIMYNTNWDGRGTGGGTVGEEWVVMRWGEQPSAPVGKAQDLPVSIPVEDSMALPHFPQMPESDSGHVTGAAVKLFYILEFDVRSGDTGASAERVMLSLELHACAHADWRSTWNNYSSSNLTLDQRETVSLSVLHAADLPAAGLQHVQGSDVEGVGGEGQWSHYKCSAGKHWFDDAEVGSASSVGMHAESARHINRSQPPPPRLRHPKW
jgi:hypothetical protein